MNDDGFIHLVGEEGGDQDSTMWCGRNASPPEGLWGDELTRWFQDRRGLKHEHAPENTTCKACLTKAVEYGEKCAALLFALDEGKVADGHPRSSP